MIFLGSVVRWGRKWQLRGAEFNYLLMKKTFIVFAFAHRTPEDQESLFNVTRPFVGEVDLSNKMCNAVPQIALLFFPDLPEVLPWLDGPSF